MDKDKFYYLYFMFNLNNQMLNFQKHNFQKLSYFITMMYQSTMLNNSYIKY